MIKSQALGTGLAFLSYRKFDSKKGAFIEPPNCRPGMIWASNPAGRDDMIEKILSVFEKIGRAHV